MTVILELPRIPKRAAQCGQSVTDYLLTLAKYADDLDLSLSEEEISSAQEGLAETEACDKGLSLEEFHTEMMATLARIKQYHAQAAK